jgi:cytochrome c oxidase subunit II
MNQKIILGFLIVGVCAIAIARWLQTIEVAPTVLSHTAAAAEGPRIIEIKASKFRFSPGEITLRKDVPVILRLSTADRAHGFFVSKLKIDADIPPGPSKDLLVVPRSTGRFTAICDHYCGSGHANMKMTVVVIK